MLSLRMKFATAILIFAISASGLGLGATQIPQGVRFYISKEGQQYFRTDFEKLLHSYDVDLAHMKLSKTEFSLNDPFNAENLPKAVREKQGDLVKRLTSNFSLYFVGLNIGEPNFKVTLENLAYELKFKSLSIELDSRGPEAYGLTRGVVALLRGEAAEFKVAIPRARAVDTKNPKFLGTLGVDQFAAQLRDGELRPARMEIPVVIDTDARGLTVKVLAVRTNFSKIRLESGFEGLLLPSMDITINGNRYVFDRKAFEHDVRKNLPEITQLLQGAVKSFFEKDSGSQIFQPHLSRVAKLGLINFSMPLAEKTRPERIELKITPTKVGIDEKNFRLEFQAAMRDPLLARGAGVFPARGSAGVPTLSNPPREGYDVAIALHPGIINGFMDRLFHYKFLDKMEMDEDVITMTAPPILRLDLTDPSRGLLHVEMETDADSVAVRTPVPIEFDLRVRFEVAANNEIDIVTEEILMDSVQVDRNKLKTWLFGTLKGKVEKRVREKLAKSNASFKQKRTSLRSIPTLDEVLGIPLKLVGVATDHGNIVIFSKYDHP